MARRASERKVERDGFTFHGYEYDGDAQREQRTLERKGYETRLLRERSDTPYLKMYSVWKKAAGATRIAM